MAHTKHQPIADANLRNFHYTEADIASMKKNMEGNVSVPQYFTEEDKGPNGPNQIHAKFYDAQNEFDEKGFLDEDDFRQRF